MLNKQPGLHRRSVWVLMFESLSLEFVCRDLSSATENGPGTVAEDPAGDEAASIRQAAWTSFDDLDIGSSFFEQYLIQDARGGAKAAEILGGEEVLSRFQQVLRQDGRLIASVVVRATDQETSVVKESLPLWTSELDDSVIHVSLKSSLGKQFSLSEQLMILPGFREADLVWFDVQGLSSADESERPETILGEILELRRSVSPEPVEQPILIVSSLRGSSRTVAPPFDGGCDEGLIHVPLWIDEGRGHSRRLQKLVGSFDLLPTLAEYLTGGPAVKPPGTPVDPDTPIETKAELQDAFRLAVGSRSLRPLLTGCDCGGDRLLRLVGDGWTALRSQQYLLVSTESKDEDFGLTSSGLDRRQLYLKPDDSWNVNDSIVPYETVADEMETVWREHGV